MDDSDPQLLDEEQEDLARYTRQVCRKNPYLEAPMVSDVKATSGKKKKKRTKKASTGADSTTTEQQDATVGNTLGIIYDNVYHRNSGDGVELYGNQYQSYLSNGGGFLAAAAAMSNVPLYIDHGTAGRPKSSGGRQSRNKPSTNTTTATGKVLSSYLK
jgi:hypothetical protein